MQVPKSHNAYTFVPEQECHAFTWKQPIATRWLGVNKGDESEPEYRPRCVAKEVNRGHGDEMLAGTPPLEAKKALFSLAMASISGKKELLGREENALLFIVIRRAYFQAPAQRPVYVHLPAKFKCPPGHCARLNVSMYGTRDAAANWEANYSQHLKDNGFTQGLSSPCVFHHEQRDVQLVVHGDDFTFLGRPRIWNGSKA